jgi:hypothetical protein
MIGYNISLCAHSLFVSREIDNLMDLVGELKNEGALGFQDLLYGTPNEGSLFTPSTPLPKAGYFFRSHYALIIDRARRS